METRSKKFRYSPQGFGHPLKKEWVQVLNLVTSELFMYDTHKKVQHAFSSRLIGNMNYSSLILAMRIPTQNCPKS